jgi:hypothetical protein
MRVITEQQYEAGLNAIVDRWERRLGERAYGPGADVAGITKMNAEIEAFKEGAKVARPRLPAAMAPTPAADQAKAADQAVSAAVIAALKIHRKKTKKMKAAKKSARVAAAAAKHESMARVQLAETFSPPAVGRSLREASRDDLAAVAAAGLGAGGASPFFRASPRGPITEAAAAAGQMLEAAAERLGDREALEKATPDQLRKMLGARLTVVSDASDLRSPFWTGGRASA